MRRLMVTAGIMALVVGSFAAPGAACDKNGVAQSADAGKTCPHAAEQAAKPGAADAEGSTCPKAAEHAAMKDGKCPMAAEHAAMKDGKCPMAAEHAAMKDGKCPMTAEHAAMKDGKCPMAAEHAAMHGEMGETAGGVKTCPKAEGADGKACCHKEAAAEGEKACCHKGEAAAATGTCPHAKANEKTSSEGSSKPPQPAAATASTVS